MDYSYYEIASKRERKELSKLFKRFKSIKKVEYSEGNVVWDAKINDSILVETKVRSVTDYVFNLIKKEGLLLEVDKFNYLNNARERLNMKHIFYIMFFPSQGEVLIYNLDNTIMEKTTKWCNRQTYAFNNERVLKDIYLIPYNIKKSFRI